MNIFRKNNQRGSIIGIAFTIIIIAIILFFISKNIYQGNNFFDNNVKRNSDPSTALLQEQADRMSAGNDEIKEALVSFGEYARANKGLVCTGGFINENNSSLKDIAEKIYKNRIISNDPLQYAINQDEAGISCLMTSTKWMLFTALNPHKDNEERNFYCVDSTGLIGQFDFDRAGTKCIPAPIAKRPAGNLTTYTRFGCGPDKSKAFKVDFIGPEPEMNDVAGMPAKAMVSFDDSSTILSLPQNQNDPHFYSSGDSELYVDGDMASLKTGKQVFENCEAAK